MLSKLKAMSEAVQLVQNGQMLAAGGNALRRRSAVSKITTEF